MKNQKSIKAVLLAASTLTVMSGAIIAPALPEISRYFAGEDTELLTKLVLTMPALVIAILAPLAGYLIDRFGRKKLLLIALLIYTVAGTSGFFINNIVWLLVSRAVLGVGVAGIMNAATTLIGDYFRGAERNQFLGTQASFMSLGGVVFLNLGGLLADWSWRGPFLVYAMALVVLPPAWVYLVEPRLTTPHDQPSSAVPSTNQRLVFFIYAMGFLGMLFFYLIPAQIPFLLKSQTSATNTLIGLAISIATVTGSVASASYARIKARITFATVYALAFLFMAVGFGIIAISDLYWLITLGLAITGLGAGLLMPNGNLWLIDTTAEAVRGRVIGGMSSAIFLGQFLSPLAAAPLIEWTSLHTAFLITAVLLVAIALVVYLVGKNSILSAVEGQPPAATRHSC